MPHLRSTLLASIALLAAACSQNESRQTAENMTTVDVAEAPANEYGFAEEMESGAATPPPAPASAREVAMDAQATSDAGAMTPGDLSVGVPQVAYRYSMGFRLPADAIKPLQERHADLCDARGREVCRIISMKQAESDGDYSYDSLQLAVAADQARAFSKQLESVSGKVDGELISSSIDGEDLSKRIVDTEARLRARTVLRDRLMEVLRTRRGTVAELVEAERGVAQVNEEIDQARSWLAEMKNRVAYSQMMVTYESGTPSSGGFIDPIRSAWGSVGSILGSMIGFLIVASTILIPLGLLAWFAVRLWKRSAPGGWLPVRKKDTPES